MAPADDLWMQRAVALAERGRGHVEPNPLVGAVAVRDGQIVGEGWHQKFGEAHAEINALAAAGDAARGATLYVTLEPCCHHGKTPPCTDAIIRAAIARVVAALEDPFPQVAGHGAARLRAAGIMVDVGIGAEHARRQNAPYLKLLATGRPNIHAKWAMSLDGKIATRTGDSKWISNEKSRQVVHELRGRMDAIVIGIGTALADDPLLTARPAGPRIATRVILDSNARLPLDSQLVCTARDVPTLVATGATASTTALAALRASGCEVLVMPGTVDLGLLLDEFGSRRWSNVLVEGGQTLLGNMLDAHAIDEVHVFIAPMLIGGHQALSPLGGYGFGEVAKSLRLQSCESWYLAGDVYLHGWIARRE